VAYELCSKTPAKISPPPKVLSGGEFLAEHDRPDPTTMTSSQLAMIAWSSFPFDAELSGLLLGFQWASPANVRHIGPPTMWWAPIVCSKVDGEGIAGEHGHAYRLGKTKLIQSAKGHVARG
jgi:hypothetical protein